MSEKSDSQGKKWLREASMRRLSQTFRNKTELIGNAAQLGMGVMHPDNLEKSGLSSIEIFHLEQWVAGIETGRQCMLAILDSRYLQSNDSDLRDSQTVNKEDFKPVELIRSLMNLPEDFLCDGGYIYETVFQRVPAGVVREALQMLVQTAFEKSPSQLGIEQINLAIKQLRLNNLGEIAGSTVDTEHADENEASLDDDAKPAPVRGSASEETFRLQIMIELIRIHIVSMNKKRTAGEIVPSSDTTDATSDHDHLKPKDGLRPSKTNDTASSKLDMPTIERHLRTPLKAVFEQAGTMSAEELEGTNSLLKPYLKQLSSLKASLAAELKDLQDSRAFLALGLSSEASDEAIKKAYRMLAIRLHPDKPGGDTARFQALQDSYQEIMRKRKADSAEREAMEEVRNRYREKTPAETETKSKSAKKESTEQGEDEVKHKESTTEEQGSAEDESEVEKEAEPQDEASDDEFDENGDLIPKPEKEKATRLDKKEKKTKTVVNDDGEEEEVQVSDEDSDSEDPEEAEDVEVEDEDMFADADIEDVMKGLDGTEDVEEVFRRLCDAKSNKSPAFGAQTAAPGAGVSGVGGKTAPVSVSYESEVDHARAVLKQIGEILQRIKKAAGEVTQLAQLNIKWQKLLDKAMAPGTPIKEVLKVLTASTGPKSVLKGSKTNPNGLNNIDACALQQAIMPVELICDWAQQVAGLAMELPNLCGVRYAAAASGNKSFLQAIERAMQLSLGALKTVLQLINSQEQLASCVRRVKDSIKLAGDNSDIQDLLLEMIRTGVKSNLITISSTVDRVVETAMAASEVRDQVQQLMKDVERLERAEVKRRAAEQETRQQEDDYCDEDKEALRKCREDRREEDRQARAGGGGNKAEEAKVKEAAKDKAESGSLDDLKDKIRLLQVQLKVQHVQALQSMNSEVVLLQGQIIKELQALPFVTSVESLFTDSARVKKSTAKTDDKDFKTSLLTLVADLIDSACHALRNDLLAPLPGSPTTPPSSPARPVSPRTRLDTHLGWMRIVLADGSSFSKTHLDSVAAALTEQQQAATGVTSAEGDDEGEAVRDDAEHAAGVDSSSSSSPASAEEVSMRLALLPDYRAKTLYMASLVDIAAVHDIIGPQLLQRLEEILLEGKECISRAAMPSVAVSAAGEGEGETPDTPTNTVDEDSFGEAKEDLDLLSPLGCSTRAYFSMKSTKSVNLNDIDDDCSVDYAAIDMEIATEDAKYTETLSQEHTQDHTHVPAPPVVSEYPPVPPPRSEERCSQDSGGTKGCAGADASAARHTMESSLEGENLRPNNCNPVQA